MLRMERLFSSPLNSRDARRRKNGAAKLYRKAYTESTKEFLEKVDIEWNSPILEWGTNLARLNQS